MEIQILVELVSGNGYRASCRSPLALTVDAPTRAEAIRQLSETLEKRARNGTELLTIKVPTAENPWLRMAGMSKNDPLFDDWQKAIAEYRRERDEDPNY